MIKEIDITELSPALQKKILKEYREVLKDEHRKLSMQEAAWYYGYTHQCIRVLVHRKRIRTTGTGRNRRVTHAAMRAYFRSKKVSGTPRLAQRNQIVIA